MATSKIYNDNNQSLGTIIDVAVQNGVKDRHETNTNQQINDNNHHNHNNDIEKIGNKLNDMSLLTDNFVPQKLRDININSISCVLSTQFPENLERQTSQVYFNLVRSILVPGDQKIPGCICPGNQCRNQFPQLATKVTEEPSFAKLQAGNRKEAAIPSIDMASSRADYISTFRELLQIEYDENARLFRRYAQYEVKIKLRSFPKRTQNSSNVEDRSVAYFCIPGIADGRPSLKAGDTVLIRPHEPISARQLLSSNPPPLAPPPPPYGIHPMHNSFLWAQQHGVDDHNLGPQHVEIHARVLSLVRGVPEARGQEARTDRVYISWVMDQTLDITLRTKLCTVRFIPSTSMHVRSLTALQWLQSINPNLARDLLSPKEPPKLPPSPAINENGFDYDAINNIEYEYEQLNANQAKFVQMVITRSAYPTKDSIRPPMVLTGPAGTGKTKTVLVAILQALGMGKERQLTQSVINEMDEGTNDSIDTCYSQRMLVCTPSHTACDVITKRLAALLEKQHCGSKDKQRKPQDILFRLYDASRQIETVPVDLLPFTRQGKDGEFILPSAEDLLKFTIIVCTCEDAHILYLAGLTNASLRQRRQCIQSSIETSLQASGLRLEGKISGAIQPHFTHLFIDEAAQATEPESLIPISVVVDDHPDAIKAEIALCGDPRQLSPNIYSSLAKDTLQRSLLERLLRLPVEVYGGGRETLLGPPTANSWRTLDELIEYSFQKEDYNDHLSVFLNLSYRGHPSFLLMPSKLYYFDKLKSAVQSRSPQLSNPQIGQVTSSDIWLTAVRRIESLSPSAYPESLVNKCSDWPLIFRGVKGKDTSMSIESFFGSNSWCNRMEAAVVVEIIEMLVGQVRVLTSSIGVMAAFRAQVVLLRRMLREKNLGAVNVGLPEDYQSVERDVIVLSLTRSSTQLVKADVERSTGLFYQPKRMNVALTRAEHLLVVVGNPDTMYEDPSWRQWLAFCRESGLWYGEGRAKSI